VHVARVRERAMPCLRQHEVPALAPIERRAERLGELPYPQEGSRLCDVELARDLDEAPGIAEGAEGVEVESVDRPR
jgi:hypothetical protein